jgi:hypothetical protein
MRLELADAHRVSGVAADAAGVPTPLGLRCDGLKVNAA